jgi:hypothetical protein
MAPKRVGPVVSDQAIVAIVLFCLGALGMIGVYLVRITAKWTTVVIELREDRRSTDEKFRIIAEEMKDDRKSTDRRLRFLEERVWSNGHGSTGPVSGTH